MKLFFLLIPFFLFADTSTGTDHNTLRAYFKLEQNKPSLFQNLGNAKDGEIELISDCEAISSIEEITKERLSKKNLPSSFAKVGIIAEDQYLYLLRDAVRFPSGHEGTFIRIAQKSGKDNVPGVAVLIQLSDNTFVLNTNFRHATRSWELELPRGYLDKNETLESAAKREVLEETGYLIDKPLFLGWMNPDSGILASTVAVFYAKADKITCVRQEETEAIAKNPTFTKKQLKQLLNDGYFTTPISSKKKKIFVRDSFLTYALCMGEIKGLF